MNTFEIMYHDLNDEARDEYLTFHGVENETDLNLDNIPIAIISREDDCNE